MREGLKVWFHRFTVHAYVFYLNAAVAALSDVPTVPRLTTQQHYGETNGSSASQGIRYQRGVIEAVTVNRATDKVNGRFRPVQLSSRSAYPTI